MTNPKLLTMLASISLFLGSCSTVDVQQSHDTGAQRSEGQSFWVEQIASGLSFPGSMVWLPDGDILIAEHIGGIRRYHQGQLEQKILPGAPAVYEGVFDGIRDMVLDPDFASNKHIFLLVAEGTFGERYVAVYRARYEQDGLHDLQRIFRTKDFRGGANAVGGRMILLADGTLLFNASEAKANAMAMDLTSDFGKLIRINRDGTVPADNPFVGRPNALPEIYSIGVRVAYGLSQDTENNIILESETGPRGGDELNIIKPGANYGWPLYSWGFKYDNTGSFSYRQSGPGIQDPVYIWMPSVTPSSLIKYDGQKYPAWHGDYFMGTLNGETLERLRLDRGEVVLRERLLTTLGQRIRDVRQGPDGYLYLLTDSQDGRLLRLVPGSLPNGRKALTREDFQAIQLPGDDRGMTGLADVPLGDAAKGEELFRTRCAACHSIGTAVQGGEIGPDLEGVFGKMMGQRKDYSYSANMQGNVLVWSSGRLNAWLTDPESIVPGTKMSAAPVTDAKQRQDIIAFLAKHSDN